MQRCVKSGARADVEVAGVDVVKRAIERWRRATTSHALWTEGAAAPLAAPDPAPPAATTPSILRQPGRDDGGYVPLRG